MKVWIALAAIAMLTAGCSSTNIAELMHETAQSDATVIVNISSIYGTAKFIRANPRTNQTMTISPDGTVTVGNKQ